jgi:hypothetical protein
VADRPTVPSPRSASFLEQTLPPVPQTVPPVEDFTGSIMSDLAFPTPFEPEPYEPPPFLNGHSHGYGSGEEALEDRPTVATERRVRDLPKRVPSVPDVPDLVLPPNDPLFDPTPVADGAERVLTFLRGYTAGDSGARPDGFDLGAVITAVRSVPEVSDAQLRWNPGSSGHTLRIEFVEGSDEGMVTREVARILRERMGLAAAPSGGRWLTGDENTLDRPARARPQRSPVVATASVPRAATSTGTSTMDPTVEQQHGRPLPLPDRVGAGLNRVVLDHVQVTTLGVDATVEVRLNVVNGMHAVGRGHGPAVDAYLLRLAATAAGDAVDQLLAESGSGTPRGRCFIEHVAVVPFAGCEVAVVVLLLVCGGFAEQLAGSAMVTGDPRQAVVRATLSAVNRRLESLLA